MLKNVCIERISRQIKDISQAMEFIFERIENIVEKEKILIANIFSLSHSLLSFRDTKLYNGFYKHLINRLQILSRWTMAYTLYRTIPTFNDPQKEMFRKHCGKRRKCW